MTFQSLLHPLASMLDGPAPPDVRRADDLIKFASMHSWLQVTRRNGGDGSRLTAWVDVCSSAPPAQTVVHHCWRG